MACAGLLTTEGADQSKPCVGLDCGCARLQRTSGRLSDFWRSIVVRTREFARGGVVGQLHLSTTQTGVRRTRIRCELAHHAAMCPTRGTTTWGESGMQSQAHIRYDRLSWDEGLSGGMWCGGRDSNPRTPKGWEPQSHAVDHAGRPPRERRLRPTF